MSKKGGDITFTKYARGMVYWADIPKYDVNPNVQNGRRPVVIVSNNVANCVSNNVTIVPCTTNTDKNPEQPTHYIMALNSKEDSMVLCENPERMSKERLGTYLTTIPKEYMSQIAVANLLATSAISFIDPELLLSIWQKAATLNAIA